jgi:TP901 family phage tail tape measure protein
MATFGIKAEDATKITDLFVRAADASVASVPELNDAMVNIGSTFNAFYNSTMSGTDQLGQLNTALAILSQRGIKGAEAGTALKSMMTNMMRTTDDVVETYQRLGITLYDNEGRLKQLPQIIGELGGAMKGMTDEQRNQTVQTLAGTYGMKAMNTLLTEGSETIDNAVDLALAATDLVELISDGENWIIL